MDRRSVLYEKQRADGAEAGIYSRTAHRDRQGRDSEVRSWSEGERAIEPCRVWRAGWVIRIAANGRDLFLEEERRSRCDAGAREDRRHAVPHGRRCFSNAV